MPALVLPLPSKLATLMRMMVVMKVRMVFVVMVVVVVSRMPIWCWW